MNNWADMYLFGPDQLRIDRTVAEFYGISRPLIMAKRGRLELRWPRWVAMYLQYNLTDETLVSIARWFGTDHATVIYDLGKVKNRIEGDPEFRRDVEWLESRCRRSAC